MKLGTEGAGTGLQSQHLDCGGGGAGSKAQGYPRLHGEARGMSKKHLGLTKD